jgi:hypothetical protein
LTLSPRTIGGLYLKTGWHKPASANGKSCSATLHLKKIPYNAPNDTLHEEHFRDDWVFHRADEDSSAMQHFQYLCNEQEQQIREKNHDEIVVGNGFDETSMQQGMHRTLKSTRRTIPTREQTEWTLGHPSCPIGVEKEIKKDAQNDERPPDD